MGGPYTETVADEPGDGRTPQLSVILTRWVLVIATSYAVLYGAPGEVRFWPHQLFAASLLASNLVLHCVLSTWGGWDRIRWIVTVADIVAVTYAIYLVGTARADFYLVYFAVLMVAAVSHGIATLAAVSFLVCGLYAGLLYSEVGQQLWRDTELLLRLPFVFGISLFFGTVAQEASQEQQRADRLADLARRLSSQKDELATERDRLKALADIGRFALTGRTALGPVLYDISRRAQEIVGVDRCSLIVFGGDGEFGYLAASGDDPSVEVRELDIDSYPELQATLADHEVTELHPGNPPELWAKVQEHLPETSPFRSFLVVPIQLDDKLIGVFFLRDEQEDRAFDPSERDFCRTAATMTASFIHGHDLLEKLRTQSRSDGLTGLLNFQAFRDELSRLVRNAERGGGESSPFSLIMVDIDNLKLVNDRFGHLMGNQLIKEVAQALCDSLPRALAVCRYGGDEFVALVRESKEDARDKLGRFIEILAAAEDDALPYVPSVSVGVAEYSADGNSDEELIDAADRAMYQAKGDGGNRISLARRERSRSRDLELAPTRPGGRFADLPADRLEPVLEILRGIRGLAMDRPEVREALLDVSELIGSRNPYVREHSRNVSALAGRLARTVGVEDKEVVAVELAALVHDVGMIVVPQEVLCKQGAFTERERKLVERYPEIGARILESVPSLDAVRRLVLHHQERWDGSGYPEGLQGDEIPLGAQVVGICDVYQALVSEQTYRPALPEESAREIIEQNRGKHWDAELAETFLQSRIFETTPESGEDVPGSPGSAAGYAAARR